MAQNSRKVKKTPPERNKLVLASLNKVEHPRRNSLLVGGAWLVAALVLAFVLQAVNKQGYAFNFMTSYAVMLGVSVLWALMRLGLGEKGRLKYHNSRNLRALRQVKATTSEQVKAKLDMTEFRKLRKQRSWWGILLLASLSAVVVITTLLVYYL